MDYKESWALKNWCFWTVVLEKTLENRLDCKEIQPINCKGNQSWIFIGRTEAEAETPILWPPDAKNWLIRKDPDAGKDWRQKEKGMKEDETVGWHHWLNGREFEQAQGDSEGQGSLACCSPWGCRGGHDWVNSNSSLSADEHQGRKFIDMTVLVKEIDLLWDPDSARPWLQRVRTGAEGNAYWTSCVRRHIVVPRRCASHVTVP